MGRIKPKQHNNKNQNNSTMNFCSSITITITITITFVSLNFFGYFTTAFAFAPVISSNSNHNNAIPQQRSSIRQQGSELNYAQEIQMHGITLVLGEDLSAVRKVADMKSRRYFTSQIEDEDEDDFIDPMEEAFDNMQHPMELMLLNRACIPYVSM